MLYLTYWFRDKDRAIIVGLFLCGSNLGGFIGAPLSGLLLDIIIPLVCKDGNCCLFLKEFQQYYGHWLYGNSWMILKALPG